MFSYLVFRAVANREVLCHISKFSHMRMRHECLTIVKFTNSSLSNEPLQQDRHIQFQRRSSGILRCTHVIMDFEIAQVGYILCCQSDKSVAAPVKKYVSSYWVVPASAEKKEIFRRIRLLLHF